MTLPLSPIPDSSPPLSSPPNFRPPNSSPPNSSAPLSSTVWPQPARTSRVRAPRTKRTTAAIVLISLAAAAAVLLGQGSPAGIAVLFVLSWPLERLWRRHPVPVRRLALRTDLAYAVMTPMLQFITLAVAVVVGLVSLVWLPALPLRPLVQSMAPGLQLVVGFLLFDFISYWTHRWSHSIPLFWKAHAIHHSTRHLDWVSGFRGHPLDGVFMAPAFAFLLAAGFRNELTGGLAVLQFVVNLLAHLNVRWRLRPLQRIVMTPEFHHWHHANEPDAYSKNLSIFLPIWDIVFGTYFMPQDRRPMRYGVNDPVPLSIGKQLLYPLRRHNKQVATTLDSPAGG
jgi:sterol desaturase/sphingolipid hydroxylase (fatty acid hydroxylase superfamily)